MPINDEFIRLSKLMSQRGLCSRREADQFIEQGLVEVNGEIVSVLGTKVPSDAQVILKQAAQQQQQQFKTVIINKPAGYVSGLPEEPYRSAIELITKANRQYPQEQTPKSLRGFAPAGRLDIDSTGLLVFTQDGRIAKTLIGENSLIEKEYLVWVKGIINDEKLSLLRHGLMLDDKQLKPAKIEQVNEEQLRFTLQEGRKRQIRRMCEQLNIEVVRLLRVRIGKIKLGTLAPGKWRYLKSTEQF